MEFPAWGKYESPSNFHCLENHCADVAACFEVLIEDPVLRYRIVRAADIPDLDEVTEARLTVIAFFHDFGKLNAGFQIKVRNIKGSPPKSGHIREAFYCIDQRLVMEALGIEEMFQNWGEGLDSLLLAALSHHGRPPLPPATNGSGPPELWQPIFGYDPLGSAKRFRECCQKWFPNAFKSGPALPNSPALAHLFAGLVAIADHIGSAKEDFPFYSIQDDSYIEIARKRAKTAVKNRGLRREGRQSRAKKVDFPEIFQHKTLHPIQQAVEKASLEHPLLILESETGSGKTEAALIRFISLWLDGKVDGLYFAVPTRSAAKQLHNRVNEALQRLFPSESWTETVLAIPGYIKSGKAGVNSVEDFRVFWEDRPDEALRIARWSAESARKFLSATTAVGTVDQALLGALKVKWAHFRGASLARSLLVVDEVHASDSYMTELLRQLLCDHMKVGGHAMLMSATLGASAKYTLCSKENRIDLPNLETSKSLPYPAISLINDWHLESHKINFSNYCKKIFIKTEPWLNSHEQVAKLALSQAGRGAKVLVIRNTVSTAQNLFEVILQLDGSELLFEVNGVPTLHHSRFAVEDRNRLDDSVEKALGKCRVQGGQIVIGTQTLEQSLDIDADFLISDICPVDVLLQRLGRLHRHQNNTRLLSFAEAKCVALVPEDGLEAGLQGQLMKNGLGISTRGNGVYRNLLSVELTKQLINENNIWKIPEMNRMLVEEATHPDNLKAKAYEFGGEWVNLDQKSFGIMAAETLMAKHHALDRSKPFDDDLKFQDQDENIRTRLGEDGPRFRLERPITGPFGCEIETFNLPAHLFSKQDLVEILEGPLSSNKVNQLEAKTVIRIGKTSFQYDNLGFRRC